MNQSMARIARKKGQSTLPAKRGRPVRMSDAEFAQLAMRALSYEELAERTGYTPGSAAMRVSGLRKAGYRIPRMHIKKPVLEFRHARDIVYAAEPPNGHVDTVALLNYIIDYKQIHDGLAPTIREICEYCDISSTSVASYALAKLERQGFIRRLKHAGARSIMVIGGQWSLREMIG